MHTTSTLDDADRGWIVGAGAWIFRSAASVWILSSC